MTENKKENKTDQEIVSLFFQRNENAIQASCEKYGEKLQGIANRILMDIESAKECENDTYLRAWNQIPPKNPSEYLFAFLAKITRNLALDRYRSQHARRRYGMVVELSEEMAQCVDGKSYLAETVLGPEEQLEAVNLAKTISDYLRTIPAQQRQMFVRRYWYMDSIQQISCLFGKSESSVKSILFRVRKGLRRHLQKEGYCV